MSWEHSSFAMVIVLQSTTTVLPIAIFFNHAVYYYLRINNNEYETPGPISLNPRTIPAPWVSYCILAAESSVCRACLTSRVDNTKTFVCRALTNERTRMSSAIARVDAP